MERGASGTGNLGLKRRGKEERGGGKKKKKKGEQGRLVLASGLKATAK